MSNFLLTGGDFLDIVRGNMALKVRLARTGAKKKPFYRVVVAEARGPRDGKFVEQVGVYDPTLDPAEIRLDMDRVEHWVQHGAQPTDTVASLIRRARRAETATA